MKRTEEEDTLKFLKRTKWRWQRKCSLCRARKCTVKSQRKCKRMSILDLVR